MKNKSNKNKEVVGLENLGGFVKKGARAESSISIPTGYFELDFAINFGILPGDKEVLGLSHKKYDPSKVIGIPCGRVVEIFGEEGGGKSYLCHRIVGQAQKLGYTCAWIDTEQSYSEDLALINGVNLDELLLSDLTNQEKPDELYYAEDVMDNIVKMIKSGVKVIVLDSVANLVTKDRMEAGAEQMFVARLARLLGDNLGRIAQWAGHEEALVIFINQLREKPGQLWGNPITTPGGHALKHNASLRISITKQNGSESIIFVDDEDNEKRAIGRKSSIRIVKNRFARPLMDKNGKSITIDVPIYYEPYFPNIEDIIFSAGRQHGIIKVYKGVFNWTDDNGTKYEAEGKANFTQRMKNDGFINSLALTLQSAARKSGNPLPPEVEKYISDIEIADVKEINTNNIDTSKENATKLDEEVEVENIERVEGQENEIKTTRGRKRKDS